ncbi:MAG: heparinase II/III family protein [Hyphomonas sp.]|uniref:heparinase II/III family protein n=1 Tax=Hyphomonas sp. TaxID=87 RepID=UPI003528E32C
MSGGDSHSLADRARSGAEDAALWRRFRGTAGEDVKIGALQRLKQSAPAPVRFALHLPDLVPPDMLRGEALMKGVWRFGMSRMTLSPDEDPWNVTLPSKHVADRLHRFAWLPDLFAQGADAGQRARALVDAWIAQHGNFNGFSWRLEPTAVRLWNWLRCGEDLFETGTEAACRQRLDSYARQVRYLAELADTAVDPKARWNAAVVLVAHAACFNDAPALGPALDRLDAECTAQILPDGGHVSRAPSRTLNCLLQLQSLEALLERAGHGVPEFFGKWIPRMGAMVAFFQVPDGALNPFNDGDESRPEVVDAALSRLPAPPRKFTFAPKSGFQKLEKHGLRLVLDCGEAPGQPFGDLAHAGALGFELSDGASRIVTSCGFSSEVNVDWQAAVRRTSAHSTLILAGRDSAVFTLNEETRLQSASGPEGISAKRLEESDEIWLDAQHGGYKASNGLLHRRRLFMAASGHRLAGEDSLVRPISQPPAEDRKHINFEIRFHLHPTVTAMMSKDAIRLLCDNGAVWRFKTSHEGARLERTAYLASGVVERPEQIVIAGFADPNSDGQEPPNCIRWAFVKEATA